MSRILLTSDIHVHDFKEFNRPDPKWISNRVKDCLSVFTHIKKACKEHDIRKVFILGDVFHVRGKIETRLYNMVFDKLTSITDVAELTIIAGNHDRDVLLGTRSALTSMNSEGITVIDSHVRSGDFAFIASTERRDILQKLVKQYSGQVPYLFFHDAVDGARIGNKDLVIDSEAIEVSAFKEYKRVFAGHYHKRQKIGNFMYLGSPLQHNFGDQGDRKKGFTILDTETNKTSFYQVHLPMFETCDAMNISDMDPNNYLRVQVDSTAEGDFIRSKYPEYKMRIELKPQQIPGFSDTEETPLEAVDKTLDIKSQMGQYLQTTKGKEEYLPIGYQLLNRIKGGN